MQLDWLLACVLGSKCVLVAALAAASTSHETAGPVAQLSWLGLSCMQASAMQIILQEGMLFSVLLWHGTWL